MEQEKKSGGGGGGGKERGIGVETRDQLALSLNSALGVRGVDIE